MVVEWLLYFLILKELGLKNISQTLSLAFCIYFLNSYVINTSKLWSTTYFIQKKKMIISSIVF
ncbi:hypothetical protein M2373_004525 [Chryseobacterium sp. JUb7]|nr:hypothetical protein [Chryseobacterium sp. JUb7]